ncbi:MAG: DUF3310 domain-containing protein [Pirellulaceae bacterium]
MTTAPEQQHDSVTRPCHYTFGVVEVIDAIEAWQLGFHLGNVVKYVARAAHKDNYGEDLRKARWYLDREIQRHADEDSLQKAQSQEADS